MLCSKFKSLIVLIVIERCPHSFNFCVLMSGFDITGTETEAEMAEEGLWELLVIIETEDKMMSGSERRPENSSVAFDHNSDREHALKKEEEDKNEATVYSEHHKQQSQATEEENKAEESKNTEEQSKNTTQQVRQSHEIVTESLEDHGKIAKNQLQEDTEFSASCEKQAEGTNSPEEDVKWVCEPFFCSL